MAQPGYENLTESELIEADHYAETGNAHGLNKMQRISAERGQTQEEANAAFRQRNN